MSKIKLEGYIIIPDYDLESVTEELSNHIALTQKEEGCLIFKIYQDNENINRFNLYEEFINQKAFEFHQQRVKKSKWGNVSVNVQRHFEITTIE